MAARPDGDRTAGRVDEAVQVDEARLLAVGAAILVVTVLVVGAQAATAEEYHVVRVVDGDTVDVRLGL